MKNLFIIIAVALFLINTNCVSPVAGGSSDHDSRVAGLVVDNYGEPARDAHILLLPDNFNPVKDDSSRYGFEAVTDSAGYFAIDSVPYGTYCISGSDLRGSYKFVKKSIKVDSDFVEIERQQLHIPGYIYISTDSLKIPKGSVLYFPGLTILKTVDTSWIQIGSIPSGTISLNCYDPSKNTDLPGFKYTKLEIFSNFTLILASTSPKPFVFVNGDTARELEGYVDTVYKFIPFQPVGNLSKYSYRFSWGDGTISNVQYSGDYEFEYSWKKAGVYWVQSQIMYENYYYAFSDPIAIIIN